MAGMIHAYDKLLNGIKEDKTVIKKFSLVVMSMASALWLGTANASLIGDSVEASLSSNSLTVSTQFTSPQIVGAGTEFLGTVSLGLSSSTMGNVAVDVMDSGFSVTGISDVWGSHGDSAGAVRIDLFDLDWIGTPRTIIGINDLGGSGSRVASLGHGADSAFVVFSRFSFDEQAYLFSFDTSQVPTPASIALFGLGLAGLGWSRRKKA